MSVSLDALMAGNLPWMHPPGWCSIAFLNRLIACLHLMLNFSLLCRYEDALVLLLTEVLNRIQFRYNQAQLEELDDETLDDDVRSTPLFSDFYLFWSWLYLAGLRGHLVVLWELCGVRN